MENTLYIALSRQATLRRELDVVANNIANMNTTAYKGERMMFTDYLVRSRGDERLMGTKIAYVRDVAQYRDLEEGALTKTDNTLDLGINGKGLFVIDTEEGERYTRNGQFTLNDQGQLVTQNNDPVLSEDGQPFFFTSEDTEISISRDGMISSINGDIGRIGLVTFDNEQQLVNVAGGMYMAENGAQPTAAAERNIAQGYLEQSNIKGVVEMSRMIEISRAYQSVQGFIDKEDERLKKMLSLMSAQQA